jgi:glycosyltransferase involved in cell wall biosynthesis
MARALAKRGVEVDVATTDDDGPGKRIADVPQGRAIQAEGYRVFCFAKQTEFYKVSLPLLGWLLRNVSAYDAVHVHAVFSFSTLAAGWACRLRRVPFVVRPLGVLNAWGMENRRRWLKTASFRLMDKPVLDRAAAMHYTSHQEAAEAARLGIRARAAVIPLGIDVRAFRELPEPAAFAQRFPAVAGRPVVLFLSRLDPKKNVELLIEAMARLLQARPTTAALDPVLVIAGDGEASYIETLRAQVKQLGIESSVIWAGHLAGEEKRAAFAAAHMFVLPSHSENFGIALLEAAAAGLPCVATHTVALAADMRRLDADSLIVLPDGRPESLAQALQRLLEQPGDAKAMANRGSKLVHQHFSTESMAGELEKLYMECRPR